MYLAWKAQIPVLLPGQVVQVQELVLQRHRMDHHWVQGVLRQRELLHLRMDQHLVQEVGLHKRVRARVQEEGLHRDLLLLRRDHLHPAWVLVQVGQGQALQREEQVLVVREGVLQMD